MNKRLLKITGSVIGSVLLLQSGALALEDYRETNRIDYMDRVFRFDMGEFLDEYEESAENTDEYARYIKLLYDFGVYSKAFSERSSDSQLSLSQIDEVLTSVVLKNDAYAKSFNAGNDDRATMYDAISKILSMLGYDAIKEQLGVVKTAAEHKLLSGVSYNAERNITFGEFSLILWNAINSKGVETDFSNGSISYRDTGSSFMEYHLEISKIKGFVNAANGLNIYKNQAPRDGYIEIDRAEYRIGEIDASPYLAHTVTAYVKKDADDENLIVHIENDVSDETLTIRFDDIISVGSRISYYDKNDRSKTADISHIGSVMYNGDANADISVLDNFENMDGYVVFAKNNGKSAYDTAIIYSYEYFVVYSADEYEKKIYLKDNAEFRGNGFIEIDEDGYLKCTLNGEKTGCYEYLPGNVIRVLQNSSRTYTEIEGSSGTVTGKVTYHNRDTGEVTINDTIYRTAKSYSSRSGAESIGFGTYGTFYVSRDKLIAGYKNIGEAVYGFLSKAFTDDDDENSYIDVFTQDNEWKKMILKEKITLDGEQGTEAKDAVEYIRTNNCQDALIRYKTNSAGQVIFIDTIADDLSEKTDKDRLVKAYEGTVRMSWQGGIWFRTDMGYRILNDRPVFELPNKLDRTDEYKVMTSANLNQDEKDTYITMYSANSLGLCQVAVVSQQSDSVATDTSYWFYCESVNPVWVEEDNEVAYNMKGKRLHNGGNNEVVDFSVMVSESKKESLESFTPGAVDKGSLMRITYNTDGYLTGADIKFTDATLPITYVDKISSYFQHFCGVIEEIDTENELLKVNCGSESFVTTVKCAIAIDKNTYKCRQIKIGELHVGERMFVYRAGGNGRICATVR